MQPDLNTPEVRELDEQSQLLATVGRAYSITTAEHYAVAGEELTRVKAAQKRLDALRKSMTRPLDEAKRTIMDFFRAPEERLAQAESGIKRAMASFAEAQERARREEQRRLDEAARAERERLARQAAEAEAKARAEQDRLRREAEEAAAAGRAAEAAKLAARAEKVEERAAAKVETLQLREAMVVAPVVAREPPKVTGVSTREVWKFRVTNAALVPDQYKVIDEARIRKVVQALKGDAAIPGVEVWSERQIAAGSA